MKSDYIHIPKNRFIKVPKENFAKLFLAGNGMFFATYGTLKLKFLILASRMKEVYRIEACELRSYSENKVQYIGVWHKPSGNKRLKCEKANIVILIGRILDFVFTGKTELVENFSFFYDGKCCKCGEPLRKVKELMSGLHEKCDVVIKHQYNVFDHDSVIENNKIK